MRDLYIQWDELVEAGQTQLSFDDWVRGLLADEWECNYGDEELADQPGMFH